MNEIKIEKGVPVPSPPMRAKYPFKDMEVGDSFFVSSEYIDKVRSSAASYARAHGMKFTTRQEGDGLRVWRVE